MSEWIEHDGSGIPESVKTGKRIHVKYRNGFSHGGTVTPVMLEGPYVTFNGRFGINPFFWGGDYVSTAFDVVAYRIYDK